MNWVVIIFYDCFPFFFISFFLCTFVWRFPQTVAKVGRHRCPNHKAAFPGVKANSCINQHTWEFQSVSLRGTFEHWHAEAFQVAFVSFAGYSQHYSPTTSYRIVRKLQSAAFAFETFGYFSTHSFVFEPQLPQAALKTGLPDPRDSAPPVSPIWRRFCWRNILVGSHYPNMKIWKGLRSPFSSFKNWAHRALNNL